MDLNNEEMNGRKTKESLFNMQKETLDSFLARGAISRQQYEKSLNTLKEKMNLI